MREIKFRIWNKLEKRITSGAWIRFLHSDKTLKVAPFELDGTDPDDYILMQYTGLHDKNGKEIYEGDVYKVHAVGNAVIEFRHDRFVARYGQKPLQFVYISNQDEVIGNIYENPELLS